MALTTIRVSPEDFSVDAEVARVREASPSAGAVVSFVGVVRNRNDGASVSKMSLEHYPGMTEKALGKTVAKPSKGANTSWTGLRPRRPSGSARRPLKANAGLMPGSRTTGQRPAGASHPCQKSIRASNISLKPNVKRARFAGDAPLIF